MGKKENIPTFFIHKKEMILISLNKTVRAGYWFTECTFMQD